MFVSVFMSGVKDWGVLNIFGESEKVDFWLNLRILGEGGLRENKTINMFKHYNLVFLR